MSPSGIINTQGDYESQMIKNINEKLWVVFSYPCTIAVRVR